MCKYECYCHLQGHTRKWFCYLSCFEPYNRFPWFQIVDNTMGRIVCCHHAIGFISDEVYWSWSSIYTQVRTTTTLRKWKICPTFSFYDSLSNKVSLNSLDNKLLHHCLFYSYCRIQILDPRSEFLISSKVSNNTFCLQQTFH